MPIHQQPLFLWLYQAAVNSGKIKKNDILALCAIGGGLTWGSCILKI